MTLTTFRLLAAGSVLMWLAACLALVFGVALAVEWAVAL